MTDIKKFEYDGSQISFDFGNGQKMINATEMTKKFNKRIVDFFRLKQTAEFIEVLHNSLEISRSENYHIGSLTTENLARKYPDLIKVIKGGNQPQGTWVHEKLALKLAAWLNPKFELWIYDTIQEILTGKHAKKIKELEWYLKRITDNTDDTRNLLDTIPFQDESLRRIKIE